MTATGYAASLAADGARLTDIAVSAERAASPDSGGLRLGVPSCPDWDLDALIDHCAAVWTFVGRSVAAGEPIDRSNVTRPDGLVSQWHDDAFTKLLAALGDRAPDESIWTFDPDNMSVSFWWRRMAHEAFLHRWDAENALGLSPATIDPELAVDGVDELFEYFIPRRQPTVFSGNGETIHFHATDADGEWVITRTPSGIAVEHAHRKSDVAARGPAQNLLLFVWGRIGPEQLDTFGDGSLLEDWRRLVRF